MWRRNLKPCWKTSMPLPRTWGNDNLGCGVSTILSYKWKGGIKKKSHSLECVEGHILCAFQACWWKWNFFSCFALKSNPWFVELFFQDDYVT
jgi:hypothetical protein